GESRGDVHADVLGDFVRHAPGELQEHAGLAVVVDIGAEGGAFAAFELGDAGDGRVFAGGDADLVHDRLHFIGGLNIARAGLEGQVGDLVRSGGEAVVLGGEVGLGPQFDDDAGGAFDLDDDQAFASGAIGAGVHLALHLLAQRLLRGDGVTAGLGEGFFAFHHGQAGLLTQGHHFFRADLG